MEKYKSLGKKTSYKFEYDKSVLETFNNKHPGPGLLGKIQLSGVYQPLSNYRPA